MAKLSPYPSSSSSSFSCVYSSALALKSFSSTPTSVSAIFPVCKCEVNSCCYCSPCLHIQLLASSSSSSSSRRRRRRRGVCEDRRRQRIFCRSFRFQQTSSVTSHLGSDSDTSSSSGNVFSSLPLLPDCHVQKLGFSQEEEEEEVPETTPPPDSTVALGLGLGFVAGSLLVMNPGLASAATEAVAAGAYSVEDAWRDLVATEPKNALSLPTWIIHVASVVEWLTAMALVWRYGDIPGKEAWKGLSWGMVPLLGGAMCACTWHFFYNAPSLESLVVLQAALTAIGNCTMWIAAFRIYQASQQQQQSQVGGSSQEGED